MLLYRGVPGYHFIGDSVILIMRSAATQMQLHAISNNSNNSN